MSFTIARDNELMLMLDLVPHRILYPLKPYPVIREFTAMLKAPSHLVSLAGAGRNSSRYADKGRSAFNFRCQRGEIVIGFSAEEWQALGELIDRALAVPELQLVLQDASQRTGSSE